MTLILPDRRMETMEGYYPGQKPVGNVKIDWEHPLTEGLRNVFAVPGLSDLPLINNILKDATGVGYQVEDEVSWMRTGSDYSISFGVVPSDMSVSTMVFSVFRAESEAFDDEYNLAIWLDNSGFNSGNTSIVSFGAPNTTGDRLETTTDSIVEGKLNTVTCTASGHGAGSEAACFIKSVSDTSIPDKVFKLAGHIDGIARIGKAPHTLDTYDMAEGLHFLYIHDRVLSAAEIESLHNHPYQFLIPE